MVEDIGSNEEAAAELKAALGDALEELHGKTLRAVAKGFAEGVDATGDPWKPLEPETVEAKGSDAVLVDTGLLRSDIMASSQDAVDKDELIALIGTNLDRAEYHEFGAPEAGLPRRPIFGPAGRYAEDKVEEVFERHIGDAVKRVSIE